MDLINYSTLIQLSGENFPIEAEREGFHFSSPILVGGRLSIGLRNGDCSEKTAKFWVKYR